MTLPLEPSATQPSVERLKLFAEPHSGRSNWVGPDDRTEADSSSYGPSSDDSDGDDARHTDTSSSLIPTSQSSLQIFVNAPSSHLTSASIMDESHLSLSNVKRSTLERGMEMVGSTNSTGTTRGTNSVISSSDDGRTISGRESFPRQPHPPGFYPPSQTSLTGYPSVVRGSNFYGPLGSASPDHGTRGHPQDHQIKQSQMSTAQPHWYAQPQPGNFITGGEESTRAPPQAANIVSSCAGSPQLDTAASREISASVPRLVTASDAPAAFSDFVVVYSSAAMSLQFIKSGGFPMPFYIDELGVAIPIALRASDGFPLEGFGYSDSLNAFVPVGIRPSIAQVQAFLKAHPDHQPPAGGLDLIVNMDREVSVGIVLKSQLTLKGHPLPYYMLSDGSMFPMSYTEDGTPMEGYIGRQIPLMSKLIGAHRLPSSQSTGVQNGDEPVPVGLQYVSTEQRIIPGVIFDITGHVVSGVPVHLNGWSTSYLELYNKKAPDVSRLPASFLQPENFNQSTSGTENKSEYPKENQCRQPTPIGTLEGVYTLPLGHGGSVNSRELSAQHRLYAKMLMPGNQSGLMNTIGTTQMPGIPGRVTKQLYDSISIRQPSSLSGQPGHDMNTTNHSSLASSSSNAIGAHPLMRHMEFDPRQAGPSSGLPQLGHNHSLASSQHDSQLAKYPIPSDQHQIAQHYGHNAARHNNNNANIFARSNVPQMATRSTMGQSSTCQTVAEERLVYVPKKEVRVVERRVPKVTVETRDRFVEVPEIHIIDKHVEVPIVETRIVQKSVVEVVEVPREIVVHVPKVTIRRSEQIKYVPGETIEVPRPERVERKTISKQFRDTRVPCVVAQVLNPVVRMPELKSTGSQSSVASASGAPHDVSSTGQLRTVSPSQGVSNGPSKISDCTQYNPVLIPVNVFIPKIEYNTAQVSQVTQKQKSVEPGAIPPAQWNTLLKLLNPHLVSPQDGSLCPDLPLTADHTGRFPVFKDWAQKNIGAPLSMASARSAYGLESSLDSSMSLPAVFPPGQTLLENRVLPTYSLNRDTFRSEASPNVNNNNNINMNNVKNNEFPGQQLQSPHTPSFPQWSRRSMGGHSSMLRGPLLSNRSPNLASGHRYSLFRDDDDKSSTSGPLASHSSYGLTRSAPWTQPIRNCTGSTMQSYDTAQLTHLHASRCGRC